MSVVVYTIGHSTREIDAFLTLLAREEIEQLVDVRTFPGSRRFPHFGRDALERSLAGAGIGYAHAPALGGRRTPRPDSANIVWRNAGFRGYADYMETKEFRAALDGLVEKAALAHTTVMCAEAVPWRCHRTMISDALVARDARVLHILDAATQPHALTEFALVVDGAIRYRQGTREPDLFGEA